MALLIPTSVGGTSDVAPQAVVEPIEARANRLIIPSSVGGDVGVIEPTQPIEQPVQPAQPLSEIIPEVAVAATEAVTEAAQAVPPTTGIADIFTGAERIAATPELGTLPEFGVTEAGNTLKLSAALLSTFDQKAQQDIIQEAIPEAKFETTPDGSVIIEVPTEDGGIRRSVLNRPGFSPQDLSTSIGQVLAFIPAARLAGLGRGLLQKLGIGAAASGATEQALQEVGVELGREQRDPTGTAIAAATGGAAELVVPAFQGVRAFLRARRAGVEREALGTVEEAVTSSREAVEGLARATSGPEVGLFQAQQTLTPSELLKQRLLPQLSASTRTASNALERQNVEAFNATADLIRTIAPDQVVETGAGRFRDAALRAREVRTLARTETASPIYKQAFRRQRQGRTPLLDTSSLERKIAGISGAETQGGQVSNSLNRVGDRITAANGDLRRLHSTKIEIDNMIEGQGANALGRSTRRFLVDIQTDLVDLMTTQSPSYRAARSEFIRLSPAVNELDASLIGRIADIPNDQLDNVASKVFNPRGINPAILRNAKQVIEDVDPGAWNDIVRVELERRFGGFSNFVADNGEQAISNIPGSINTTLFGNPKNRRVFLSALNPEQRQNFVYLETVLRRSMQGRAAGSPTTPFKEALDRMRGVAGVFRDTLFRPVSTLQDVGAQGLFDARVARLAEAMFNPQWRPQMNQLRALDPNSPAAARAMTQLLDDIGKEESTNEQ